MASADEILSALTAALYGLLFIQFTYRFARSTWWIYFFCSLLCAIRIAAFGLRAYVDAGSLTVGSSKWLAYYITEVTLLNVGAIFVILILARLYHSILPKIRHHAGGLPRGMFERTLVDHTRLFLLPVIGLIIAGGVLASMTDPKQVELSLTLRKVAVIGLMVFGLAFLYGAWLYRNKFPEYRQPFTICLVVTVLFNVSLVYKVLFTFSVDVQSCLWAFYVFSPLLELAALVVLAVDLQTIFLGHKHDKIPKADKLPK
ncbi:hypothetical protein BGZ96_010147 [Linnemannia gamsii]|uniref:Uncharacterized protein n=1 Tax=Linnemannia gamsii TaxID=64522 RepID=A0ABQ7JVW9_9FUNG|nr:hypothetical protein BGZ96_010147 [Linnemannia gamsii]